MLELLTDFLYHCLFSVVEMRLTNAQSNLLAFLALTSIVTFVSLTTF